MADFCDEALAISEQHLEHSLRRRKTLSMPFSGACLACDEPVDGERRFCDVECRDDWEQQQRRKFAQVPLRG